MSHPHHCLVTQKLQSTYFNVLLAATLRWFTAGGAIRIAHYDVIDDVITWKLQEIEKNGDHLAP